MKFTEYELKKIDLICQNIPRLYKEILVEFESTVFNIQRDVELGFFVYEDKEELIGKLKALKEVEYEELSEEEIREDLKKSLKYYDKVEINHHTYYVDFYS